MTSPLNDSVLSDVSYGVDVCNRFACLLVEPTTDDCADPTIRSDSPDSSCMNFSCLTPQLSPDICLSFNLSSVPSFHGSHPAVLVVSKAENSGNLFQEISSPISANKAVIIFVAFKMMLAQEFVRPWPLLIT